MPWRYAFLHFFGGLILGSIVMTSLSFILINAIQGTLHVDGLGMVFLFSMLYSFFLSIPGVGHLNLYFSRHFQSENFDLFWDRFKRRYLHLLLSYSIGLLILILAIFGFSYPAFTITNALTVLPWVLMMIFSYGLTGWLILRALKEKLRSALPI